MVEYHINNCETVHNLRSRTITIPQVQKLKKRRTSIIDRLRRTKNAVKVGLDDLELNEGMFHLLSHL